MHYYTQHEEAGQLHTGRPAFAYWRHHAGGKHTITLRWEMQSGMISLNQLILSFLYNSEMHRLVNALLCLCFRQARDASGSSNLCIQDQRNQGMRKKERS